MFLSPRAIERRSRYKITVDSTDLPVNPAFLDSLKTAGATIINASRWLNQALIQTMDEAVLNKIKAFPFVAGTGPLSPTGISPKPFGKTEKLDTTNVSVEHSYSIVAGNPDNAVQYGNNFPQIHIHEGEHLHNLGYRGENMLIALLDAGYKGYLTNPMFDSLRQQNRVMMTWDFVNNEAGINEDDVHGMYCLSTLAANRPGLMVGTAPRANYLLFRTENNAEEYPYEEQNWLVAAEKADSAGADMISSSLGYLDFDDPVFNYPYAARNGNISLITRGADMAAAKGILVMNSGGNNGDMKNENKFVSCPADGDSVFSVGAISLNKTIASFSSWGPAFGGKVKPNIVSVGQGTVLASTNGNTTSGNGTSFSNPNIAGLIACLWQAFPEFNNIEIMKFVQQSSDRAAIPDERFGYGIPNMRLAYEMLASEKNVRNYQRILGKNIIKAYPVPFRDELNVSFLAVNNGIMQIRLLDAQGRVLEQSKMEVVKNQYYTLRYSDLGRFASGVYYLQTDDGTGKQMLPIIR